MSALGEIRTPNRLIRRCIFTTSPVVILSHRIAYTPLSDRISETSRFSLPTSASECEVKVGLELGSRSDTQLTFRVLQEALLTFMWMPGLLWKAYEMKESLRAIFPGDLEIDEVHEMLDRWCRRASEYETTEFNPTFKDHPNAEEKGFSPPPGLEYPTGGSRDSTHEFVQPLPTRNGFHSVKTTLALVCKFLGPIDLKSPYEGASLST